MHAQLSLMGQLSTVTRTFYGHAPGTPRRSPRQVEHLKLIHNRNFDEAVTRYRDCMAGRGWLITFKVECLLGCMPTAANAFLRKLHAQGYVDRRPRGNAERYVKNQGWEYYWIEGK